MNQSFSVLQWGSSHGFPVLWITLARVLLVCATAYKMTASLLKMYLSNTVIYVIAKVQYILIVQCVFVDNSSRDPLEPG